jgi:hypothetical protein
MMFQQSFALSAKDLFDEIKFFVSFVGVLWVAFGAYNWVKDALSGTRDDVKALKTEVSEQTKSIVHVTEQNTNEIKGLRDDMKLIIGAMMQPTRARAARR